MNHEEELDYLRKRNADLEWIVNGYKNLTILDHGKIILNKLKRKIVHDA